MKIQLIYNSFYNYRNSIYSIKIIKIILLNCKNLGSLEYLELLISISKEKILQMKYHKISIHYLNILA